MKKLSLVLFSLLLLFSSAASLPRRRAESPFRPTRIREARNGMGGEASVRPPSAS